MFLPVPPILKINGHSPYYVYLYEYELNAHLPYQQESLSIKKFSKFVVFGTAHTYTANWDGPP